MVYPVFSIESINTRCAADIKQFLLSVNDNDETKLALVTDPNEMDSKEQMQVIITRIITFIEDKLKTGTYVSQISHIEQPDQNQLWLARTYLFYQLLIFATVTFKNEKLYTGVYTDIVQFPYRGDIVNNDNNELGNFKMGIFGSMSPTSDIDIGIQYSGNTLVTPALAYIVSRFENLFLIFTGNSSLDFDIETYADMMTIPNPNKEDALHPDYFYLDASKFEQEHFVRMLQCAGNSIVRNILLAYADLKIKPDLSTITFNNAIKAVPQLQQFTENLTDPTIQTLLNNTTWFEKSKREVAAFLGLDYNAQRYEYYKKVEVAEQLKYKSLQQSPLTTDQICNIMVAIGDALTYRMESYTCAPTVIHVVRILQAAKETVAKYITLIPATHCTDGNEHLDPFCTIGSYGYILSILEQIGYMYRFHLTYCQTNNDHYDTTKCQKKINKYFERYNNALVLLENVKPPSDKKSTDTISESSGDSPTMSAGSKKQSRKKHKKHTRKKHFTKRRSISHNQCKKQTHKNKKRRHKIKQTKREKTV